MSFQRNKDIRASLKGFFKVKPDAKETASPEAVYDFFSEKFDPIRVDERGNCLSCAAEAAKVLMSDAEYKATTINFENATHDEEKIFEQAKSGKKFITSTLGESGKFFDYLNSKEQKPGSVFIANSEDHVCVIFKSFENELFLIDGDAHFYRKIQTLEDLSAPHELIVGDIDEEELEDALSTTRNKGVYNYFYDAEEGSITLYNMGTANECWKNLSKLMEKHAEQMKVMELSQKAGKS
jgi:hypothetical protein